MGEADTSFRPGALRAMDCFRAGWDLIKADYWLFLGISVVGYLIGALVPFGLLLGPMMCGIYLCLFRAQRGREVKFEILFKGFDYFLQSLIATLLMMVPILAVVIAGYSVMCGVMFAGMPAKAPAGGGSPGLPAGFWAAYAGFILGVITISIVVGVLFFFVYPLIADRKMQAIPAIKTSLAAVRANLGGVIGVILINVLLNILGQLACCVGQFFVLPLHFAAIAVAYRQVFPDEDLPPTPRTPEELDYDERLDVEPPPEAQ